ncbi:MAG: hypothetical protein U9N86_04800 [Bacteroidota bacterium]|nr:hypothetical protein [Bacteroidota bacterium]
MNGFVSDILKELVYDYGQSFKKLHLMKSYFFRTTTVTITAIALLGTVSCTKDVNLPEQLSNQDIEMTLKSGNSIEFATVHLSQTMKAVAHLSQNPEFRSTVYGEVNKHFDGDWDVLVQSLLEANYGKTSVPALLSKNPMGVTLESLNNSLNSFKGIEEMNYYPQIFIPNYSALLEEGVIGENSPIFVIAVQDGQSELIGYQLSEKGNLTELPYLINEKIAFSQEVWVISINERVDKDAQYKKPNLKTTHTGVKIENMTVKDHKEQWAWGASEVNIMAWLKYHNGEDPWGDNSHISTSYSPSGGDYQGTEIRSQGFSRTEVSNQTEVTINLSLMSSWDCDDYVYDPVVYTYCIFEYDAWPVDRENVYVFVGNGEYVLYLYRSAHVNYSADKIYGNLINDSIPSSYYVDGYDVSESDIEFNVVVN